MTQVYCLYFDDAFCDSTWTIPANHTTVEIFENKQRFAENITLTDSVNLTKTHVSDGFETLISDFSLTNGKW